MNRIEITPELLAELKEKAEKATPGPWEYNEALTLVRLPDDQELKALAGQQKGNNVINVNMAFGLEACKANAAYIAAANPAIVLALVARIEELAQAGVAPEEDNHGPEAPNDPQALTASYFAGARAERDRLDALIERLRQEPDRLGKLVDLWRRDYDKLVDHCSKLEKEADWLAKHLERFCRGVLDCRECGFMEACRGRGKWRQTAREPE